MIENRLDAGVKVNGGVSALVSHSPTAARIAATACSAIVRLLSVMGFDWWSMLNRFGAKEEQTSEQTRAAPAREQRAAPAKGGQPATLVGGASLLDSASSGS